jgi:hypothetical protein
MRTYLGTSIPSLNANKLRGLLAEVDFRSYLETLGYGDRVSRGGWIARVVGPGEFGRHTAVFFPETVRPRRAYNAGREPPTALGLHTIAATFHQSGVHAYFCAAEVGTANDPRSLSWKAVQLGLPTSQPYRDFPAAIPEFTLRTRAYNFLTNTTDTTAIPNDAIPEEFSKEHLRVTFQTHFMQEMSDVDGIFWGQQHTYPVEVKEKTPAASSKLGPCFGLDLGPFVKLAFYAAKRGNLHSLFVVREIDDETARNVVQWWVITFDRLAQFASWNPRGGGTSMTGMASTTVLVPRSAFTPLDAATLEAL